MSGEGILSKYVCCRIAKFAGIVLQTFWKLFSNLWSDFGYTDQIICVDPYLNFAFLSQYYATLYAV